MLIGLHILGTSAAPACSFKGFICTTVPFFIQVRGYLEIVSQSPSVVGIALLMDQTTETIVQLGARLPPVLGLLASKG
jgi:hypothetical protein